MGMVVRCSNAGKRAAPRAMPVSRPVSRPLPVVAPETVAAPVAAPVADPVAAKAAPKGKEKDAKEYAPIPADAFVYKTSSKSVFIAMYSDFVNNGGERFESLVFTKGYINKEGETVRTGRSGSIPMSLMRDKTKGPDFIAELSKWLLTYTKPAQDPPIPAKRARK